MHTHNIMHSISSLVECAQKIEQGHQPKKAHQVISLSAGTGTGGLAVGRLLAERLGTTLYDKEILELLAQEAHLGISILDRLDERLDGFKGAWLYSILAGENLSMDNYRRNLINVIRGIACRGGVIIGRGSSFILAHLPVFRVHIVGSLTTCVERLATQEGLTHKAAERKIKETDKARLDYVRKLFVCDNNDPTFFDLIVNSDHLSPEHIADLILKAREYARFE